MSPTLSSPFRISIPALLVAIAVAASLGACKSHPSNGGGVAAGFTTAAPPERPYGLHLPRGWNRTTPAPLVVFFHGYGGSGAGTVAAFDLEALSDAQGFVLAYPDGTIDAQGRRFWNATDACCDFGDTGVDDVAYVSWLLDDVEAHVAIDPQRVYVAGHSNGGSLSLRLACDLAPRLAAAVSIAGFAWDDPSRCRPRVPVSVLQVQGDADAVVRFGGGLVFDRPSRKYPGAPDTVATFARADGCGGALAPAGGGGDGGAAGARGDDRAIDWDDRVPGAETRPSEYRGCPPGVSVTLWTVGGGSHVPEPTPAGLASMWAWMAAHSRR